MMEQQWKTLQAEEQLNRQQIVAEALL